MEKRWKIKTPDEQKSKILAETLKVHPLISRILVGRGIENFEEAKKYFRPGVSQLHDPFLMKDMNLAVDRILLAINRKEKILIFGDYDVDGTSSVALMIQMLRTIGEPDCIDFYIPHRQREG